MKSVSKCLKTNKLYPYIQLNQELIEADFEEKLTIFQWALSKINDFVDFFKFVLFTDQSMFYKSGFVKRRNFHF